MLDILKDPDFVSEIQIQRIANTVNAKGRNQTITTDGVILGHMQPASPKEREILPEAERVKETKAVWSLDELTTDTRILIGDGYRVASVEKWDTADGVYYKALAVLEDQE